jgi:DNA-binding IclR family transcriptional regulator
MSCVTEKKRNVAFRGPKPTSLPVAVGVGERGMTASKHHLSLTIKGLFLSSLDNTCPHGKHGPMSTGESAHVVRTLRVLEALAARTCTASELATELDAHPRTIRRLLGRLVAEGYAIAVPDGRGEYMATLKLVALAGHVLERTDLVRVAFPYVARLRNASGEASQFSVPGEDGVLHLAQETGASVVMVKPRLGEQVPYHCTASGKALLAHLPDRLERVLRGGLEAYTERTLTDPVDLLLELTRVRSDGFAVDDRELSDDLRCVAAPVRDHTGAVIACIGISAPALRLTPEGVPDIAGHVMEAAGALSETLGFDARRSAPSSSVVE